MGVLGCGAWAFTIVRYGIVGSPGCLQRVDRALLFYCMTMNSVDSMEGLHAAEGSIAYRSAQVRSLLLLELLMGRGGVGSRA